MTARSRPMASTAMNSEPNADRIYGRFGRLSAAYDAGRREFPSETVAYVASQMGSAHPFVLDLACGTGISTRQLAAAGIRVVGCDIDPRMVRYATGRGGGMGYVIGRAEAIPFRDQTFGAVACFRAYHWFEPARGYRSWSTVVCEGALCGRFGAPPEGESQIRIRLYKDPTEYPATVIVGVELDAAATPLVQ